MSQQHFTSFSRETFQSFRNLNRTGPIHMLNLIKLRDKAEYPDGRAASGREAYAEYGRISAPVFKALGGKIVWRGELDIVMVGPDSDAWDICFIAEYPSVAAFTDMLKNPVYREAMAHRQAGVVNSRLICLSPLENGEGFYR